MVILLTINLMKPKLNKIKDIQREKIVSQIKLLWFIGGDSSVTRCTVL